jgi:spore coat protein U-like protein
MGWAACSVAAATNSLGTTNSLSLITQPPQAAGAGGLRCDGVLQLLTGAYVRTTLLNSTLTLQGPQGQIPFRVYTDPGFTNVLNVGQSFQYTNATLNLLTLGGTSTGVGMYFRALAGANVPAGVYTGTVTFNWQWAICTTGLINICNWDRSPGLTQSCPLLGCGPPTSWGTGAQTTINLTLVVTKACAIDSLPLVDFGARPLVTQFQPVTSTFTVRCTNTEGYTLGFGNGEHFQAPWRNLASGANRLRYNIYRPGTTTVWNLAQPVTAAGTGLAQSFQFRAVIDPAQGNVPAGTYIDNVVLTISY